MKRDDLAAPRVPAQPSTQDTGDSLDLAGSLDTGDSLDTDDFADADDFVDTDVEPDFDDSEFGEPDDEPDGDEPDGGVPAFGDLAEVEEPPELDDRGKRILAFEQQWWRQAGSKEQAIRDTFNLSATRYYQVLNTLLDSPLALAHDPVVVQRLRRLRASRSRSRR